MRILWLLPQLPYPPDTGGKQDPFNMMRVFSELGDDITAGIIYFQNKPVIPPEFTALVSDTFLIPANPEGKVNQLFASLSDPVPYNFRRYYSEEGVGIVADAMSSKPSFDAVIIDHFHLGQLTLDAREKLKEKVRRNDREERHDGDQDQLFSERREIHEVLRGRVASSQRVRFFVFSAEAGLAATP